MDSRAVNAFVSGVAHMSDAGIKDLNALTKAIKARDTVRIRALKEKWAGTRYKSYDGGVLSPLTKEAEKRFPLEADFTGLTKFVVKQEGEDADITGLTHEDIMKVVYEYLGRRAGGCGFPHEIEQGCRHVKTRTLNLPGIDPHQEPVHEYTIPAIKHVKVCILFRRVPTELYTWNVWFSGSASDLPVYSLSTYSNSRRVTITTV